MLSELSWGTSRVLSLSGIYTKMIVHLTTRREKCLYQPFQAVLRGADACPFGRAFPTRRRVSTSPFFVPGKRAHESRIPS